MNKGRITSANVVGVEYDERLCRSRVNLCLYTEDGDFQRLILSFDNEAVAWGFMNGHEFQVTSLLPKAEEGGLVWDGSRIQLPAIASDEG